MSRWRWTPELIGQLRLLVVSHNQRPGAERVRLEDLRKAFAAKARGPKPMEAGMRGVDRFLLAKSDDQPRDARGRFAPTGSASLAGQGAHFQDVASQRQHQQLKDENAGYAAANTAAIPETRASQFLGPALVGTSLLASAVEGATARFGKKSKLAIPNFIDFGRWTLDAATLGGAKKVTRALKVPARVYDAVYDTVGLAPAKAVRALLERKAARIAAQPASGGIERAVRASRYLRTKALARIGAGATAAAFPGLLFAPGAAAVGNSLGPSIDTLIGGRTVEKSASHQDLLKRWSMASLSGAARRAVQGFRPAEASPVSQAAAIAANRIKRNNLGRFGQAAAQVGGAVAGGAAAAGAGWGAATIGPRVYYRDEDGKFTSKEKAVISGAAGAVGAVAGLLAARRGVGAIGREAQRRVAGTFSQPHLGAEGVTSNRFISGDGLALDVRNRLEQADRRFVLGRRAGRVDPALTERVNSVLAERAGDRSRLVNMLVDDIETKAAGATLTRAEAIQARSAAGKLAQLYGSPSVRNRRAKVLAEALAPFDKLTAAAAQGPEAWGVRVLDNAERSQVMRLVGGATNKKGGWWEGVADAPAVKKTFLDTWRNTGSLDQAISKLPKAKQGDIKAIRGAVDAERSAFGARVEAFKAERERSLSAVDEVSKRLEDLTKRKKALDREIGQLREVNLDDLKGKAKAAHTERVTRIDNEKIKLEADLQTANRDLVVVKRAADAARRLDPASTSFAEALDEAHSSVREALRPRNPFKQGEFLEAMPTAARLKQLREDAASKALESENRRLIADATAHGARVRSVVDDVQAEAAKITGRSPSGPVQRQIEALASRVAPYAESMARDIRLLRGGAAGYVKRLVGDAPEGLGQVAQNASQRVSRWIAGQKVVGPNGQARREGGAWNWAKRNKGTILTAGAAAGVLDYSADGRVNLDWRGLGRLRDDPLAAVDSARKKTGAFFRIYNAGAPNEAVLTGVTIKGKDGKDTFVAGRITRPDGSESQITAGTAVEDVTRQFLRGPSQEGGGSQRALGDGELRGKIASFLSRVKDVVTTDDLGGETFKHAGGSGSLKGDDAGAFQRLSGQYQAEIAKTAEKIRANLGGYPDDFYRALNAVVGENGKILTLGQMRKALVGEKGLFGADARLDSGMTAQQLETKLRALAATLPPPANEGQARDLRRALRLLGERGVHGVRAGSYAGIDGAIDRRLSKGVIEPPAPHSSTAAPAASKEPSTAEIDDRMTQKLVRDLRVRLGNEIGRRTDMLRGGRPDQETEALMARKDRLNEEASTLYQTFLRDYRGQHSPEEARRLAAEQAWGVMTATLLNRPTRSPFSKMAAASALSKAVEDIRAQGGRRPFDEHKIQRHGKGDGRGGEFAPKGEGAQRDAGGQQGAQRGPASPRPTQEGGDSRSYFEPVRLGGTLGSAVGGQAAWELFQRYAPAKFKVGGRVGRFVVGMLASVAGSVGGAAAGEAAGAKTYEVRGRQAPGSYEPPSRPAEEEAGRTVGGLLGSFAGTAARTVPGGIALGTVGSLGGEELFGAAAKVARERFGVQL